MENILTDVWVRRLISVSRQKLVDLLDTVFDNESTDPSTWIWFMMLFKNLLSVVEWTGSVGEWLERRQMYWEHHYQPCKYSKLCTNWISPSLFLFFPCSKIFLVLRVLSNNNCCQFLALPIFCLFNLIFPGWRNGQSLSTFCELLWDDQRDCSEMWSRYTKISRLFKGNWMGFRVMYSNCNHFLSCFIMRTL